MVIGCEVLTVDAGAALLARAETGRADAEGTGFETRPLDLDSVDGADGSCLLLAVGAGRAAGGGACPYLLLLVCTMIL